MSILPVGLTENTESSPSMRHASLRRVPSATGGLLWFMGETDAGRSLKLNGKGLEDRGWNLKPGSGYYSVKAILKSAIPSKHQPLTWLYARLRKAAGPGRALDLFSAQASGAPQQPCGLCAQVHDSPRKYDTYDPHLAEMMPVHQVQ
jgi:hypothetical protein